MQVGDRQRGVADPQVLVDRRFWEMIEQDELQSLAVPLFADFAVVSDDVRADVWSRFGGHGDHITDAPPAQSRASRVE